MSTITALMILGCLCVGAAIVVFLRTLFLALASDDLKQSDAWRFDISRINELRRIDPIYRLLYPVVKGLARMNMRLFSDALPGIGRELQAAGLPRAWTPQEYLARMQVIALLLTPAIGYSLVLSLGKESLFFVVAIPVVVGLLLRRQLQQRAEARLRAIKRRLPFLLDLITLTMEAGSTFLHSMENAVEQFHQHAVGQEFGRVLAEMRMGKSRTTALNSLRDRLHDDEITSIVGSIIQGEELGTPLARIFRTQADVLRLKRTQRAETIAGEAGVKMLLPAVLIMASTVIIILGPFVLGLMFSDFL
jgi:tight adherence protein C